MMTGRAALETLLRDRQLDVTLTTVRPWGEPEDRVASTGLADLDRALGGGLRRGHLSEIVGARSTGRTAVLCRVLEAATARGEVVALVDTCDRFDPGPAAAAGLDLARLLWIRDRGDAARALKALNLVVQAGGFGVVAFDLADVPHAALRQFPHTTWMRLSRVIEGSQTALVLLGSDRIARSSAGATIALEAGPHPRGRWTGTADRARYLARLDINPRVIKAHAPSHVAPSHVAPSHVAPSHVAPSHVAPSHVTPSHVAPSHVARRTSHVARST